LAAVPGAGNDKLEEFKYNPNGDLIFFTPNGGNPLKRLDSKK
jgi:hypothetical protein